MPRPPRADAGDAAFFPKETALDDEEALVLSSARDMKRPSAPQRRSWKTIGFLASAGALLLIGAVGLSGYAFQGFYMANVSGTTDLSGEKASTTVTTTEDLQDIGTEFLETFAALCRLASTQHLRDSTDIIKMMADKVEWDWSGGIKGSGTPDLLFTGPSSAFGGFWGQLLSDLVPLNIFTSVDPGHGEIFISFDTVMVIPKSKQTIVQKAFRETHSEKMILNKRIMFELVVDNDRKIKYWKARWNVLDPSTAPWMQVSLPGPPVAILSVEEGVQFANDFLKMNTDGISDGFNSAEASEVFADHIKWDWSGDQPNSRGSGTMWEYLKLLGKTWHKLFAAYFATNVHVAVDTFAGEIFVNHHATIFIDGQGKVPVDKKHMIQRRIMFEFHVKRVDGKVKAYFVRGRWNNLDPILDAELGAVTAV
jgi:hypothetical protein